jgi:hypothetical protein
MTDEREARQRDRRIELLLEALADEVRQVVEPPMLELLARVARTQEKLDELRDEVCTRVQTSSPLVDAAELSRLSGRSRKWIYRHKEQLGVEPVGDGPRPRLQFDRDKALRVIGGHPIARDSLTRRAAE